MAQLTDADKKSFIDKILGVLGDPDTKARLVAKDWDPSQRTTNLQNGVKSVTNDEGIISKLESAVTAATDTRRADLDANYDLASATLSSIEGALGKNDDLVNKLHQFRGALHTVTPAKAQSAAPK
jgi:hypothetical protein